MAQELLPNCCVLSSVLEEELGGGDDVWGDCERVFRCRTVVMRIYSEPGSESPQDDFTT